ncbi:unnamed protein product [Paramecium sonneborni]|uniref:Uncharacterized protein n=1 Tax=Paramecium sonneborni TaxID=65129 RepID=A0A8S1N876_9CILI|nr:unnamed protein product [Paramecium sonneborni]
MNKLAFLGCLAIAGIGYYLINENDKKTEKMIEKGLLIKILKELQKEYYPAWERMIEYGKQQFYVQNKNGQQKEELRNVIESKFQNVIEKIEQRVFIKYEVSKEEVNYNCNNIYKNDNEILGLVNYINLGFEQAIKLELNLPQNQELPDFINEDLILKTQNKILISSAKLFNEKIREYKEKNNGQQVIKHSQAFQQILQDLKWESKKEEILKQNGFGQQEEASSKQYLDAIKVYSQNRQFKQKLVQLNERYDKIMSEILDKGPIKEDEIDQMLKY